MAFLLKHSERSEYSETQNLWSLYLLSLSGPQLYHKSDKMSSVFTKSPQLTCYHKYVIFRMFGTICVDIMDFWILGLDNVTNVLYLRYAQTHIRSPTARKGETFRTFGTERSRQWLPRRTTPLPPTL